MARFVILFASFFVHVFGCQYERVAHCTRSVQHEVNHDRLSLAANLQDLELYCDQMKKAHRCIEIEIENCSEQIKESYRQALQSEKIVMVDVCAPGRSQQDFLEHAPCFRKMLLEGGSCHVPYSHLMATTVAMNPSAQSDDSNAEILQVVDDHIIADVCCAYHALHACYMENTLKDCGAKALEISLRLLEKVNGGLERSCSKVRRSCAGYVITSAASPVGGILRRMYEIVQHIGMLSFLI